MGALPTWITTWAAGFWRPAGLSSLTPCGLSVLLLQESVGPLREDFSLSSSALIGLLVVAVAIATIIVISLVMLRRRQYGSISHGIVEVSRQRAGQDPSVSLITVVLAAVLEVSSR